MNRNLLKSGGERGIRTPGGYHPSTVFKSGAFLNIIKAIRGNNFHTGFKISIYNALIMNDSKKQCGNDFWRFLSPVFLLFLAIPAHADYVYPLTYQYPEGELKLLDGMIARPLTPDLHIPGSSIPWGATVEAQHPPHDYSGTVTIEKGSGVRLFARAPDGPPPQLDYTGLSVATGGKWYGELHMGAWDGAKSTGRVWAASLGYQTPNPFFVKVSIGPAHISDTNYALVSHTQLLSTVMIGYRGDGYELGLGYRHLSNGGGILNGEDDPNLGMDFRVAGIGVQF